jgi:hypothetical protein
MATFKQNTVKNTDYSKMIGTESGFGKRDDAILGAAFTSAGLPTPEEVTQQCKDILQGEGDKIFVDPKGNIISGSDYWGTIDHEGVPKTHININYINAPDITNNDKDADGNNFGDGKGAPETPYVPPLTSPGAGSFTAFNQDGVGKGSGVQTALNQKQYNAYGTGDATTKDGHANPSDQTIKGQTIGAYVKGDSQK